MRKHMSMLAVVLSLAACDDHGGPAASFAGGGFVFNYRIGEAFYGVVINTERKLPAGAVIQGQFENPAGGPAIVVKDDYREGQRKYMLRTPALKGIKKDVPYKVVVEILDKPGGNVIDHLEKTIKSDVDQSMIPQEPMVIGPGYTLNPNQNVVKIPPAQ
jgi:hypothetical protein